MSTTLGPSDHGPPEIGSYDHGYIVQSFEVGRGHYTELHLSGEPGRLIADTVAAQLRRFA